MSLLKELSGHPDWIRLQKVAEQTRPLLPTWNTAEDNTNEWKKLSAMQEGFDLCWQIFKSR